MKPQIRAFALLSIILTFGCSESTYDDTPLQVADLSYYNIAEGKYIEYLSDTIVYRGQRRDTLSGMTKIQIGSTFINTSGDTIYRMEIYTKTDSMPDYNLKRVESLQLDEGKVVVSNDGLFFIRSLAPAFRNSRWDATALVAKDNGITIKVGGDPIQIVTPNKEWNSQVLDFADSININSSLTFYDILVNEIVNDSSGIDIKIFKDYYAKGVGLVRHEWLTLEKNQISNTPFAISAERGFIIQHAIFNHN